MQDLAQNNYISGDTLTQLWNDMLFRYHTTSQRLPLQMVQGTFYSE
jgi:hypothetical protein